MGGGATADTALWTSHFRVVMTMISRSTGRRAPFRGKTENVVLEDNLNRQSVFVTGDFLVAVVVEVEILVVVVENDKIFGCGSTSSNSGSMIRIPSLVRSRGRTSFSSGNGCSGIVVYI